MKPRVRAICEPVLIGDRGALEAHAGACRLSLDGIRTLDRDQLRPGELEIGAVSAAHGRAALDSAHTSVKKALGSITAERVLRTLKATDEALRRISIEKPSIAVSGVNPHAGEGGLFGDEEERAIPPAVEAARAEGIVADGPIGADTLIQRAGYDAYVVMLHDQGHVAAKLLAPDGAAALTIGTPVLFSSVAHGAALGIAGQGKAQHGAMVEAITRLVGRRRRAPAT